MERNELVELFLRHYSEEETLKSLRNILEVIQEEYERKRSTPWIDTDDLEPLEKAITLYEDAISHLERRMGGPGLAFLNPLC